MTHRTMRGHGRFYTISVRAMASITTVLMSFAVLCQAQTPVDFLEAANAGMSVDSSPHQPSCYVPYALYPRRLCVEIDLHAKCYTDQTKAWDEECAMCRAGRGYLTMEDCTAVRGGNEPAVTPDNNTDEDTPEPEVIKDLERDYFDNETSTRSDFFAHCSKEISEQLKIVTLQQHPGTNCPFKTNGLILWHDQAAWRSRGAEPPQLWSDVEVPSNTKVLITACSLRQDGIYTKIVIPASSEVIFADEDLTMKVGAFHVYGKLRAGSSTCRLLSRISIEFHERWWEGTFNQGILVMPKGELDLHGKLYRPTWTRLSQTAGASTSTIKLQERVNWTPGQQIVITTTIWRDEWNNQNEVRTIRSIKDNGKTLELDAPLKFAHYGGEEYQAEVALLSRSLVLSSSSESEKSQRGGHIHVDRGEARLRGVEAFRMGQRNVLGAYPFHFHLLGDAYQSYIQDCAVYRSFYRGFVIHGTSHTTVTDNVAFDVAGSCFYLEDGVEEHNLLDNNLAAYVHVIGQASAGGGQEGSTHYESASLRHPGDAAAAGFWISNALNTITNNAASGGWAGFSMPRLDKPVGLHRDRTDFSPQQRPTKVFSGNTAHSSGYFWQRGSCIYIGGSLWYEEDKLVYSSGRIEHETRNSEGEDEVMIFEDTKVFLCQRGIKHWGRRVRVDGYKAYDVTKGATLFGEAVLNNAIITGRSNNNNSEFPGNPRDLYQMAGFQWYDTDVKTIITDTTFRNYPITSEEGVVWYTMVHSDQFKPMGQCASLNIKYENVQDRFLAYHQKLDTGASRFFNWIDYDGSAFRRNHSTLVGGWPSWWKTMPSRCKWNGAWGLWICDHQPWRKPARLDLRVPGFTYTTAGSWAAPPTPDNYIGWVSQFGADNRRAVITRNEGITGVTGDTGWYVHIDRGAPKFMEIFVTQMPRSTGSILLSTRYPQGTNFVIKRLFNWYPQLNAQLWQADSLAALQQSDGQAYHFDGRWLTLKVTDPGSPNLTPLKWKGITIEHSRYYDLRYEVTASCDAYDGKFCGVQDRSGPESPSAVPDRVLFESSCTDVPVPGPYTCEQQRSWGKCDEDWMKPYCANTCGRCEGGCSNIAPSLFPRCDDPKLLKKCGEDWIKKGGYCKYSCGRCSEPGILPCSNKAPVGDQTCDDIVRMGDCNKAWVKDNNTCQQSCNACSNEEPPTCHDFAPPGGATCSHFVKWGSCAKAWMIDNNWCLKSCGRCSDAQSRSSAESPLPAPTDEAPVLRCTDEEPPPNGESCRDVKESGACYDGWIAASGFCHATCGRNCTEAIVEPDPETGVRDLSQLPCFDRQPWGPFSCFEHRHIYNNCGQNWMLQGGFCSFSCGFCSKGMI